MNYAIIFLMLLVGHLASCSLINKDRSKTSGNSNHCGLSQKSLAALGGADQTSKTMVSFIGYARLQALVHHIHNGFPLSEGISLVENFVPEPDTPNPLTKTSLIAEVVEAYYIKHNVVCYDLIEAGMKYLETFPPSSEYQSLVNLDIRKIADILLKVGDIDRASQIVEKLKDPRDGELALYLARFGKHDEARALIEKEKKKIEHHRNLPDFFAAVFTLNMDNDPNCSECQEIAASKGTTN